MNTVIDAGQVLIGDRIKISFTVADMIITREGVVDHMTELTSNTYSIRTKQDYSLGPTTDSVIELLDRPKPKRLVPTLMGAVVKYTFNVFGGEPRTAVRSKCGKWVCYDDAGHGMNHFDSDLDFETMLNEMDYDFDIVFAGVAK